MQRLRQISPSKKVSFFFYLNDSILKRKIAKILTSTGGAGVAKFPSSGRSGGWPQAESAVLLHRLSVLPPPEQEGGPNERD